MGIKTKGSTEKPGDLKYRAANEIGNGWLEPNGALISRANYAGLFAAIGTTYGAGDGVTTFQLPDFRSDVLRALDNGRGVDAGRVFGSSQLDGIKESTLSHIVRRVGNVPANTGEFGLWTEGGNSGFNSGSVGAAGVIKLGSATETRMRNSAVLLLIKY